MFLKNPKSEIIIPEIIYARISGCLSAREIIPRPVAKAKTRASSKNKTGMDRENCYIVKLL